jgi:hypothetical protein
MVGERLYGSHEGRAAPVSLEVALRAPRAETFQAFVGPELPPDNDSETCWCEENHAALVDCPDATPCEGACGTLTRRGYLCRFCEHRTWVAAAWIVQAAPMVPLGTGFAVPPRASAREGASRLGPAAPGPGTGTEPSEDGRSASEAPPGSIRNEPQGEARRS